jgi:hypothetical protein
MSRIENSEIDANPVADEKQNDLEQELEVEESGISKKSSEKISSSDIIEESEKEENKNAKKLLYNKNKSLFLTKIAAIACIYWITCCLTCVFIIYYNPTARTYYWLYRLRRMTWIYVLFSVMIKMAYGFAGSFLQKYSLIFLAVDIYYSFMAVLGLYFYFNYYIQTMYIGDGAYVILAIFLFTGNWFAFLLSTLKHDKIRTYNYIFGFILMEVTTAVIMALFKMKYDIITMGFTKYNVAFVIFSIINFYTAINAYYMVNYRGKKYFDDDYIFGYFSFYCDWFSSLWIDVLDKNKGHRRKTMMDHISYETDSDSVDVEKNSSQPSSENVEANN